MVRVGVLIYLILFGVVEPLLCPCFAQQFVSSLSASNSEGTLREVPTRPCCPVLPTPARGAPLEGQCPCGPQCPCQSRAETVALPSSRTQLARPAAGKVRSHLFGAAYLRWSNIALLNANLISIAKLDGAFLSPRDRLHVICLMRC